MTVGLCLITWNEIDGCKHDVPEIDKTQFDQLYCIDGGSTDGTVEYLKEQGFEVYQQTRPGLNVACIEGCQRCRCDAFVFYHPKGTVPTEDIYRFRPLFEQGYGLVVASRMMKDSHNEEDDRFFKPRKWFVLWLAVLARLLFRRQGNVIYDVLHGFRGFTVEAFNSMSISDKNPSVDIESVCRAYKLHISRVEFPTREKRRIYGKTHFKSLPTGMKLLEYIIWEIGRK